MNIVDCKSKFDSLTTEMLHQYTQLETSYINLQKSYTEKTSSVNVHNISLCNVIKDKEEAVVSLEKSILGYKQREQELMNTISHQKGILSQKQETMDNSSRHDMIRSMSKEITAKDKEIERLTKEVAKQKEVSSHKTNVTMSVTEKSISGWSPTSSASPMPQTEPEVIALDEPAATEVEATEVEATDQEPTDHEATDQESEEEELYIIKYRKKPYYRDSDNNVYVILDDEDKGECIGTWEKQSNGKSKLVRH